MNDNFVYNDDYPTSNDALNPEPFPVPTYESCVRITTRIIDPNGEIRIVNNVLVTTGRRVTPVAASSSSMEDNSNDDDDYSSSSDSSSDSEDSSQNNNNNQNQTNNPIQRAYLVGELKRKAIYGRVYFGHKLEKLSPPIHLSNGSTTATVEWRLSNECVAIKEMEWDKIKRNAQSNSSAEKPEDEMAAMQYFKSSLEQHLGRDVTLEDTNVMIPYDILSDDQNLYSIMPFCDGGELFYIVDARDRFPEDEARYWFQQLLRGIEQLQMAGMCHRDISLENFLADRTGKVYVIDFGMSIKIPMMSDIEHMMVEFPNMGIEGDAINGPPQCDRNKRLLIRPQVRCGKVSITYNSNLLVIQ
jgi:hypothetical protein